MRVDMKFVIYDTSRWADKRDDVCGRATSFARINWYFVVGRNMQT